MRKNLTKSPSLSVLHISSLDLKRLRRYAKKKKKEYVCWLAYFTRKVLGIHFLSVYFTFDRDIGFLVFVCIAEGGRSCSEGPRWSRSAVTRVCEELPSMVKGSGMHTASVAVIISRYLGKSSHFLSIKSREMDTCPLGKKALSRNKPHLEQ